MSRLEIALVATFSAALSVAGCGGGGDTKPDAATPHDGAAGGGGGGAAGADAAAADDGSMDRADAAGVDTSDAEPTRDVAGDEGPAEDGATPDRTTNDGPGPDSGGDAIDAAPSADPYPFAVSGTRLRVERVTAADGTVVPIGLYDTTLDVACVFTDADETGRCLPRTFGVTVGFLDEACTMPVVVAQCAAPQWAIEQSVGVRVYKVGAARAAPGALWRRLADGSCEATTADAGSTFAAATLEPASSFVATSLAIETRPGLRLGARYRVGTDGSKLRTDLVDTQGSATCLILPAESDGKRRCFPEGLPLRMASRLYADEHCTVELYEMAAGQTPPAAIRLYRQGPASAAPTCSPIWSMRTIGAVHAGAVWRRNGTTCAPGTVGTGSEARALSADLSPTALVTIEKALEGGARLGAVGLRGSDGSTFLSDGRAVVDRRYTETCAFTAASGGTLRCLPPAAAAFGFSDGTCSDWTYSFADQSCAWPGAVAAHRALPKIVPACDPQEITGVHARGAAVATPFAMSGASCDPSATTPANIFLDGADVALTEFASGATSRE